LADYAETELLGQIPIVQSVREAGDNGTPVAANTEHMIHAAFKKLALNTVSSVNTRNAQHAPTKIVEIKHG